MKKLYVWEAVDGLTQNYHDGGGCLVVCNNLEDGRELLKHHGINANSEVFKEEPDYTASIMEDEDRVIIFPDAGCC